MAYENFFLNFPSITYNGYSATNIFNVVKITDQFKNNFNLFYDYTISNDERADAIAFNLYGKSAYVWIIYLFNDILDPYYGWPLNQEEFDNMIISKYGSYPNASLKIKYFQNNWYDDNTVINISRYQSLPANQRKYWKPQLMAGNKIMQYVRNNSDTIITTNAFVNIPVTYSNLLNIDEVVTQGNATGQVTYLNNGLVILQHINGSFSNNGNIVGNDTGNILVPNGSVTLQNVIPIDEIIYFNSISSLDYEEQQNSNKKNIKLLREEYLPLVEQALKEAFS